MRVVCTVILAKSSLLSVVGRVTDWQQETRGLFLPHLDAPLCIVGKTRSQPPVICVIL